jgi:hypothetical protein
MASQILVGIVIYESLLSDNFPFMLRRCQGSFAHL